MKKGLIPVSALALVILLNACRNSDNKAGPDSLSAANPAAPAAAPAPGAATNGPKTYTVTFLPDTAVLGKDKEAFVRISNAKAVAMVDPDGKDEGIDLSFTVTATNKNKMGGNRIYMNTNQFRLALDNGNNLQESAGGADWLDPESSKELSSSEFKLPAGTRPRALNLFLDDTRVSVEISLQ